MKKLFSVVLVLSLILGILSMTGCQKEDTIKTEKTVMHLSLNPEIEVVLDEEDKVVTVNALNEEGNLIISAEAFENVEGKSSEEVVELFIQVSKDTGYLVSGQVTDGDNQVSISISGDKALAQKLYDDISQHLQEYIEQNDIHLALTQVAAVTEEELRQALAECAPYIEEAKLAAMEHKELVEELVACRKETAQMYSQELKNAYYEAKCFAFEQAKLEVLKQQLPAMEQVLFDVLNKAYVSSVELLEKTRYELLVADYSAYQLALADLRLRKAEFLVYRNELSAQNPEDMTQEMQEHLASLEAALERAEAVLVAQGDEAHRILDEIRSKMDTGYNQMMTMFEEVDMNSIAEEISEKQTAALGALFTEFESQYAEAKQAAKDNCDQMLEELQKNNED